MNKRLIIIIMLSYLLPLSAFPQKKGLGISAGITYSGVLSKGDTGINRLTILTYTEGLTGSYAFNESWFLNFGIKREEKGFKIEYFMTDNFGNKYDGPYYTSLRLRYLTVPLLLNIRCKGKMQFYTGLGAHINFLLSAYSSGPLLEPLYDQNGIPLFRWKVIGKSITNDTKDFKQFDLSLAWQGGIRYFVTTNLLFDFRFSLAHGVIPISKEENIQNVKFYNRTGGARLGVLYTW